MMFRKMSEMRILFVTMLAFIGSSAANAENPDISSRRASERTEFTNDEIKDGFFKIALKAELELDGPVDRVRKFDEPVRIFVDSKGLPDRRPDISAIVADIRSRVNNLDMAVTSDRQAANVTIVLVSERDLKRTIRARYGRAKATRIQQSLNPECLSGIGKDKLYRIRRAEVILPVDAGEFTFYDCAYEELLQALGAINDDASVPWTMFNDDVQMGFFDVYDQYLLNILYDPRIRAGMTKDGVAGVLPEVLPAVRTWISNVNPAHAAGNTHPSGAHAETGTVFPSSATPTKGPGPARAFSSEVDTGSREENASEQESRAPFRFHRNGNSSSGYRASALESSPTTTNIP